MQIIEPTTMATDYLLAAITVVLAIRIFRDVQATSARLWGLGFVLTAVAALAGGTAHGFVLYLSEIAQAVIWKITVYCIGLTSLAMLSGTIVATTSGKLRKTLLTVAVVKFILYAIWMSGHDAFRYVILDYGPAMLLIVILQTVAFFRAGVMSGPWIVGGILVSFIAAGVQLSGVKLHTHFNHNDLYHVIQMAAMYLIYRGVLLLTDYHRATGMRTSPAAGDRGKLPHHKM
jgi:hypothetical protein